MNRVCLGALLALAAACGKVDPTPVEADASQTPAIDAAPPDATGSNACVLDQARVDNCTL